MHHEHPTDSDATLTDRAIVARIWPLLGACALGLVPFTVYSNFLVEITRDSGHHATLMGSLRGVGGVAALLVGLTCAPLLDRISRRMATIVSLVLLASACLVGIIGSPWAWVIFCLFVGASTSILNPAASAMAADRFRDEATSGRAATQVSSVMTLTAVLSAPLLAVPAAWWGWRGDLVATSLLCLALAWSLKSGIGSTLEDRSPRQEGLHTGYVQSLKIAVGLPCIPALLTASMLRTAAFMGQLAYLAVLYNERFQVGPGLFSLVWTLSGLAFFLGNWFGGVALRKISNSVMTAWIGAIAAALGTAAIMWLFGTHHVASALGATTLLGASHAVLAATVTTLLVRQSGSHRGTVLGLNGAGQSLGVCIGASIAGLGLALSGWNGAGIALGAVTACAAVAAARAAWHLRAVREGANP